jgi:hypothetical protein
MLMTVLLTTLFFGAFATYARNLEHPEVRPVAVISKDQTINVAGIYAGQDSERLYIGILKPRLAGSTGPRSGARIVGVPRREVSEFSVGGVLRPGPHFDRIAASMLAELHQGHGQSSR